MSHILTALHEHMHVRMLRMQVRVRIFARSYAEKEVTDFSHDTHKCRILIRRVVINVACRVRFGMRYSLGDSAYVRNILSVSG